MIFNILWVPVGLVGAVYGHVDRRVRLETRELEAALEDELARLERRRHALDSQPVSLLQ